MAIGVQVWSQTAANNATSDTNINFAEGQAPSSLNDSCRAMMASAAKWRDDNNGTLITSGSSSAFTVQTNQVESALTAGYTVTCQFHSAPAAAATLAVDGLAAKQIQLVPGFNLLGTEWQAGSVQKLSYETSSTAWQVQSGLTPTVSQLTTGFLPLFTNAASGNTTIGTTSTYTDAISVAQGSSGVFFACGQVMILNGSNAVLYYAKLWDGTTVMSEAVVAGTQANQPVSVSVCGALQNPAGNIKISIQPSIANNGSIVFNQSGTSKDTYLTAFRIG